MDRLAKLIQDYVEADTLEERSEAAEGFVREVSPELWVFVRSEALSRGFGEDAAEEVFQDIWVGITEGLGRVRSRANKPIWAWCYRVARNKLFDHVRKLASAKETAMDREALEAALEASEQVEQISPGTRHDLEYGLRLLAAAKPPCFAYLWDYYVLGWDYAAIADTYALAYDTMRMRIQRCLELAQKLVAENP